MIDLHTNGHRSSYRHDDRAALATPQGRALAHRTGDHTAQFYLDDAHLAVSVGQFIGAALAAGDAAVVLATPEHLAGIRAALPTDLDLEQAIAGGRFVCLDAADALSRCMRDGQVDAGRFAQVVGGLVADALRAANGAKPRVAAYGELVALLSADGRHDQALQLERFWNELMTVYPISLLCGYPIRSFPQAEDGEALRQICDAHTAVMPAENYPITADEDERRRAVALLQQQSFGLRAEVEERASVEAELRRRETELAAALASRDEFLLAAAHELKTPVTSLRVYAQLLQRDIAKKDEVPLDRLAIALEAFERQTSQLNHLIGRLLEMSQIESGTLRLERMSSDLPSIVRSAIAQQECAGTHQFVLESPPRLTAVVDPVRLELVVTILLGNAVKFSPMGSTITVALSSGPGGVRLSVNDQGAGIPVEQRELVFQRFHQAHGQRNVTGLGLGLFIARQIVELHGGTIWAEEAEHPGARFVVLLPAD